MEWQQYRTKQRSAQGTVGRPLSGEEFPCAYCRGTGHQLHMRSQCPVCGGKGSNEVGRPAAVCAFCRGAGEAPPRSHLTCPACCGRGVIAVKEPLEKCNYCRGLGRATGTQLSCLKCKGAGVFTTDRRGMT